MKLFISWSGPVSQQIAETFRTWFPLILPALQPFITSADIDKGAKWLSEISKELEASSYGIVCLTKDNLASQWLAFEAGALSKHLDGRVATVLLGVTHADIKPPLSMFQGTLFNEQDVRKLIASINKALPQENQRADDQLDTLFPLLWPQLRDPIELILQNAPGLSANPPSAPPLDGMMLEVLSLVRQQTALLSDPEKLLGPVLGLVDAKRLRAAIKLDDKELRDLITRNTWNSALLDKLDGLTKQAFDQDMRDRMKQDGGNTDGAA